MRQQPNRRARTWLTLLFLPAILAGSSVATADSPRQHLLAALDHLEPVEDARLLPAISDFLEQRWTELATRDLSHPQLRTERRNVLVGVAALFDPDELLLHNPLTRTAFSGLLTPLSGAERSRVRHLTYRFKINGREDTARHFFLSAGLTATLGPFLAERFGRLKEYRDARDFDQAPEPWKQGFSFVDLAHNLAGIRFACQVLGWNDSTKLDHLPSRVPSFLRSVPALQLPERMGWNRFQESYGGKRWPHFEAVLERIRAAVGPNPSDS